MIRAIILLAVIGMMAKPALKNCPRCKGTGTCCSGDKRTCNCGVWDAAAAVMKGSQVGTCTCTR